MSWLVRISPKSNRASQGLHKNLLRHTLLRFYPSSKQGLNLKDLKLYFDKQRTKLAPQPPKKAEKKAVGKRPKLSNAFNKRVEKKYPFDKDVEEIFEALTADDKLTLPDSKRLGDVGKTNDPRYYPYNQMISYPLNQLCCEREDQ